MRFYTRVCVVIHERSGQEVSVTEPDERRCPTCGDRKPSGEFYAGCSECKTCKRGRSRSNRAAQARKIAAFERFVDALIILADKTGEPPAERGKARADTATPAGAAA
jgi:hypothetical protein